jgi:hypothetical protein
MALYGGDSNFGGSTSKPVKLVVEEIATTFGLFPSMGYESGQMLLTR